MNGLVNRLRTIEATAPMDEIAALLDEAADRIEQLELKVRTVRQAVQDEVRQ